MSGNELGISFRLNGEAIAADAPVRMHAADFLRHRLGWTGTHVGCEQGVCGMCTILVDGAAIKSCLMLAVQLDGTDVGTVESWPTATACMPRRRPSRGTMRCSAAIARRAS